jgi:hypothetical protein
MHGTTYVHLAPLTVTDKQLQPLRFNQQQAAEVAKGKTLHSTKVMALEAARLHTVCLPAAAATVAVKVGCPPHQPCCSQLVV